MHKQDVHTTLHFRTRHEKCSHAISKALDLIKKDLQSPAPECSLRAVVELLCMSSLITSTK